MKTKMRNPTAYPRKNGQSLVELAISLTFIILLLAGAVDFGIAFFSYVALRDAAQEGALYGAMNPTDNAGIETRVRSASTNPIDLSDTGLVDVDVVIVGSACEGGGVQVDVTYDYPISMPFMTAITGPTITLRARVTDTILQPVC